MTIFSSLFKLVFKYSSIFSLKRFLGVTVCTTPFNIFIGIVERGKTFGIASRKSRLEKVSKFLGIRGPIIISELIIFSLLDISKILFNEFSVSKTFKLIETPIFLISLIA